jgi:hypothetical protein
MCEDEDLNDNSLGPISITGADEVTKLRLVSLLDMETIEVVVSEKTSEVWSKDGLSVSTLYNKFQDMNEVFKH